MMMMNLPLTLLGAPVSIGETRVCVGYLFFKDTEPSPLRDSFSVRQQGPTRCVLSV
jgi:hypothetical protein